MDILQNDGNGLVWFRRDLRLDDNPALCAAVRDGRPLLALFILDQRPGGASAWWLERSLTHLRDSLDTLGVTLVLRSGDPHAILCDLIRQCSIGTVYANLTGLPDQDQRDRDIAHEVRRLDASFRGFQSATLARPDAVKTRTGDPFRVFTPFWRALRSSVEIRPCLAPPRAIRGLRDCPASETLADWNLSPRQPDWAEPFEDCWQAGEASALRQLDMFRAEALETYADQRDRPDLPATSRLSPHLSWGEISPRRIWHAVRDVSDSASAEKYLAELGWRDFSYHLLHHFPEIETRNFRKNFDRFAWREDAEGLRAWSRGETGYPIVDAGMRQLWQTGWMHNRVRMVAASFLVKHLLIDWRRGLEWFADTLVDHDRASNAASWQWVAGCGADAAPYFRIFNPMTQGRKFDPHGDYVRRWCPELGGLSDRWIHAPFEAGTETLAAAGVRLGQTYPGPVVDHPTARQRALDRFARLKADAMT